MDEKDLKVKFEWYLQQKWEDLKKYEQTKKRFWSGIFDMFLNWLESYKKNPNRTYKQVFFEIIVPQMKKKLDMFWDHYFKGKTYEKYESLFVSFMIFAKENREYINNLIFDNRKEKLENIVEWKYWKNFDKKEFLKAWHIYIKEDKGQNWDKLRRYLADIYWYLNIEWLNSLYDIFFDSYEICSKVTSKNNEHKWKENYKKRDAFGEAFSSLESKLPGFNWEKLSEVKSLFWKYLNFIPKYRKDIFDAIGEKTVGWKVVQGDIKTSLLGNLFDEQETINTKKSDNANWLGEQMLWEQDDFWIDEPTEVKESFRDVDYLIADITDVWNIIAPINNYWNFSDSGTTWEQ